MFLRVKIGLELKEMTLEAAQITSISTETNKNE